jgi:hypothetical protein
MLFMALIEATLVERYMLSTYDNPTLFPVQPITLEPNQARCGKQPLVLSKDAISSGKHNIKRPPALLSTYSLNISDTTHNPEWYKDDAACSSRMQSSRQAVF